MGVMDGEVGGQDRRRIRESFGRVRLDARGHGEFQRTVDGARRLSQMLPARGGVVARRRRLQLHGLHLHEALLRLAG